jgi:hypothetical protein
MSDCQFLLKSQKYIEDILYFPLRQRLHPASS